MTYPGSQRVSDKPEPSLQPQIRAMEEQFLGHVQHGWLFGSVLTKVVFHKEAGMENASSSRKPSLQALSFPTCFMSSLSLGCTANVSPGDGIYMCEC